MAQLEIKAENELQTRCRIVRNHMKDRDNCILLKIDTQMTTVKETSPFGFHFELDKKKYDERKKRMHRERITRWFTWIAVYHKKFGIRHLLLVLLLASYVFMGGAIFEALEAPRELEDLKETIILMNGIIGEMTIDVINVTLSYNGTIRDDKLARMIKKYYKTMLEAEGRFHGSVWHKAENIELHLMWYFSSATFYCMTLFTTIGYGTIACQTVTGRVLSIVYACIGIPLMLVVLGDIGEWFQNILTDAYIYLLFRYKRWRGQKLPPPERDHEIFLPIWIAFPLVGIYILSCALFIKIFDHNEGKMPGIGFGDAIYFTFISLTTIGLGDIMPYNIQYSPVLASVFLLGLALVSIVNTSIYAQLYDVVTNSLDFLENQLDRIHKEHHTKHGHKVFQDLSPCIQLLVCSFPHPGHLAARDAALEGILKPANADDNVKAEKEKKDKKVTYSSVVRKRTISYSGEREDEATPTEAGRRRAPTLGAMGGRDLAKFRKQRQVTRRLSDAQQPSEGVTKRRSSDTAGKEPMAIPIWSAFRAKVQEEDKKKKEEEERKKREQEEERERKTSRETVVVVEDTTQPLQEIVVDETVQIPDKSTERESTVDVDGADAEEGESVEQGETSGDEADEEEGDRSRSPSPSSRPPPLLVLPPPGTSQPDSGDSDDDDDDDDDDWVPSSKFANLKRGSVFVPSSRNEEDEDSDGGGPLVEYIP